MEEYIKRKDALDIFSKYMFAGYRGNGKSFFTEFVMPTFYCAIEELPSANVRENISVRLTIEPRLGLKCPNCNSILSETHYHFCPWCGAEILGIDFGKWEYKKE